MQHDALYFPYVHVRDDDWLKAAALYWPSVRRLVPRGYQKHDSPTARALAEAKLLRDEAPEDLLAQVSWDLLRALEENADLLVREFGLARVPADPSIWADRIEAPFDVGNLGWIHLTKFRPGVVEYLQDVGLARVGRGHAYPSADPGGPENWVGMHPALAGAYMTALAHQLSEQARFQPLTDQDDLRVATPSSDVQGALRLLVGNPATEESEGGGVETYVMLALQCARPKNLSDVSVDKIIECRTDLRDELVAFRAYVDAQQAELAEIATTPIERRRLELFARHVEDTVQIPLQRLERALKRSKLEPTRSLMMAGTVTSPALVDLAVAGHPAAAAATGTVAAVGSAWWQIREQRRQARETSSVSYLLDVRDRLTPRTLASRVRKVLRGTYGTRQVLSIDPRTGA